MKSFQKSPNLVTLLTYVVFLLLLFVQSKLKALPRPITYSGVNVQTNLEQWQFRDRRIYVEIKQTLHGFISLFHFKQLSTNKNWNNLKHNVY